MRNSLRLITASILLVSCADEDSRRFAPAEPGAKSPIAYLVASSARPAPGDSVIISIHARSGMFDRKLGSFAGIVHLPEGIVYLGALDGAGARAVRANGGVVTVALASGDGLGDDPLFAFAVRVNDPEALFAARLEVLEATRVDFNAIARGATTADGPSSLIWGDISNDGTVAAADAQAILTASLGMTIPAEHLLAFGDANCDGAVGALDAQVVLSKVVGLAVSQFCVGSVAKAVVSGEIRDVVTFAPVSGARVTLESSAGSTAGVVLPREATTDGAGSYTIYNNVPNGTYRLAVSGTSFQGVTAPGVTVNAAIPQKVDATLTPTSNPGKYASLSGRVLLADGTAAAGAAVQLSGGVQTNGPFKATTTGADGTYTFSGVSLLDDAKIPIASFTVIARASTGATGSVSSLTLVANEIKSNVTVSLSSSTSVPTSFFAEGFESGIPATWTRTGLWTARGTNAITNSAYPAFVKLAPNDNTGAAVPLPLTGSGAAWAGSAITGNFIGTQSSSDSPLSGGTSTSSSTSLLSTASFSIPSNAARATLAFDSWFEIESVNPRATGYDIMEITVTDVGTSVTTSLTRLNPFEDPAASDRKALPFTSGGFNRLPVWRPVYLNLDSYKGRTIRLGFCFRTVDHLYNGFRGWLIDNLRVSDEIGAGALAGLTTGTGSVEVGNPGRVSGPLVEPRGTVTSCSGGVQTVPISSVTVTPTPVSLAVNETSQLLATPKDVNGTALAGKTVSWASSNSSIATVTGTGLVTAKAAGSATITATVEGVSGSASITVTGAANTMSINAGNNQSATAGTAVTTPPSVKITNAAGQGVSGITVNFAVTAGGGALTGATQVTNTSGIATVGSWTLGAIAGANSLSATASGVTGSPQTFSATGTSAGMNLVIDGVYVTQATQTMNRDVPLVAGRPALVRVFVKATQGNSAQPAVKVTLYRNSAILKTYSITAPAPSVPTSISEATLDASWNVAIDAADMQSGLSLLAEVDAANTVTETSESDNRYPASGTPLALDVRTVPTFNVTFIPVTQPGNVTGRVSTVNKDAFMDFAQRVYPLATTNVQIREPYSYSQVLASSYGSTWSTLLSEIDALRLAEAPSRYYYGVIQPTYTNGGTGLGRMNTPSAIGVDWDSPISSSATDWRAMTAAHEWGHNFGREHIGCGNPDDPDPLYPHDVNTIGAYGYDVYRNTLIDYATTRDLMSYCTPLWVSDYTYKAVLTFRGSAAGAVPAESGGPVRGLLVWGQIGPDGLRLEPSFEITAIPSLPGRPGPTSIEAFDASGRPLFDLSFAAEELDHLPGIRHFAYVVPLPANVEAPASLRLRSSGRVATQSSRTLAARREVAAGSSSATLSRVAGRSRLQWDAATYPVAMVRDAVTGHILSFARGGTADILTSGREVDVIFSDGARSARRAMRVPE